MTARPLAYIVDDETDVRESLGMLLRSVAIDVEAYESAAAFLAEFRVPVGRQAVMLLDVRMSEMSGMALLRYLCLEHPWLPIIMMTGHGDIEMAVDAMKLGARDFVTKPFRGQEMIDRIQELLRKQRDCDPGPRFPARSSSARLEALTPREREVFDRLVAGEANKAIATSLGISVRTVESHRASLMEKLDARTLVELVLIAFEQ